jgi:hypothetical protein
VNSLKPVLIVAIVAGVGYGVWSRLNRRPEAPLPALEGGWDSTPNVSLGNSSGNWTPGGDPALGPGGAPTYPGIAQSTPPSPANSQALPSAPAFAGTSGDPAAMPPDANAAPTGDAATGMAAGGTSDAAGVYSQAPAYPQTDTPAAVDPANASYPNGSFSTVLETARQELDAGRLAEGLLQLSAWYDNPQLSPAEQQQLTELLDQVAGTVIYSNRSIAEPAYEVQQDERLEDIANRCYVPMELLAKINGIDNPLNVRAGDRLKIVRGPFEGMISLDKRILTLWVGGCYAGRFAIGVGRDFPPSEGQYTVELKQVNPECHLPDRVIPGGDPSNPLGARWLGLTGGYGLHGTNDPNSIGRPDQSGCIGLGPRDVDDVYDILIVGSKVTIKR